MPIFIHACEQFMERCSCEPLAVDRWINFDRISLISKDSTGVYAEESGTNVLYRVDNVCTDPQLLLESLFSES